MHNVSIKNFLDEIFSKRPVPSAGVSLAISGAFGTALIGKALLITLKNKKDTELECLSIKMNTFINNFIDYGNEDMDIVLQFLQKDTGATEKAIAIPLKIAENAIEALQQYRKVSKKISNAVKGDAEAGALLLETCCKGNLQLAQENLFLLDEKNKSFYKTKIEELFKQLKFFST